MTHFEIGKIFVLYNTAFIRHENESYVACDKHSHCEFLIFLEKSHYDGFLVSGLVCQLSTLNIIFVKFRLNRTSLF